MRFHDIVRTGRSCLSIPIIVISFGGQLLAYLRCRHVSHTFTCVQCADIFCNSIARAHRVDHVIRVFCILRDRFSRHETVHTWKRNKLARVRTLDDKSPYFILFYPFSSEKKSIARTPAFSAVYVISLFCFSLIL